mgnify:CR=1 FL=1|jgi:putative restriction modification system DNA specificity subunit
MAEWISKTLGELTSFISKGIPPKYVDEKNENTIRVLNQKCNRNFEISYNESRIHNAAVKKVPENKLLHSGDVLINSTGTGTAGRVAQIFNIPMPTTVDGHMILLRPTKEIDPLYYGYVIKSYQKKIESLAEGSTGQTEINRQRLQDEIYITFPKDRALQKEIGTFLFQIDEKIKNNSEINNNLEQQAQAIFKSWFIDFEPFSNRKPSEWSVSTLGNVSIMGAGGDKPQNVSPIKTDLYEYPIYSNGLSNEGLYGFTDKPKISEESVTVSARGTIGFVCLRHIPYVPIVRLVTLIPKPEIISAKYLYLWLKQLHITGTGTTQQQLTVPDFQKTEILVPSQEIVTLFTATVEPIFEKIWFNQNENEKLSSLRDTLLPKLMTGELDVSDTEI